MMDREGGDLLDAQYRLKRVRELEREIASKREERKIYEKTLQDLGDEQGSRELKEVVQELKELCNEIDEHTADALRTKVETSRLIDKVEDGTERELLRLRYIHYHTWEDIAEEMHYTLRHTYRLRKKALASYSKIVND